MYIHTRRYNTTWILHFGSNVTLSSSIATPNDSRYKWKIPPLPSPPFIHSFRFFLSFLFFFFLTNKGMGPECTRGRSDFLSLTTISTIFKRHRVFDPILIRFHYIEISFARDTIPDARLASGQLSWERSRYMCTDRCTSSWLSNTESNMRENSSFFEKKFSFHNDIQAVEI